MDDFDVLYMMKTPLFMGNPSKTIEEAASCEVSDEDTANLTLKNLLLVRALTGTGDIASLKQLIQGLVNHESQGANVQQFSMLIQSILANVS